MKKLLLLLLLISTNCFSQIEKIKGTWKIKSYHTLKIVSNAVDENSILGMSNFYFSKDSAILDGIVYRHPVYTIDSIKYDLHWYLIEDYNLYESVKDFIKIIIYGDRTDGYIPSCEIIILNNIMKKF